MADQQARDRARVDHALQGLVAHQYSQVVRSGRWWTASGQRLRAQRQASPPPFGSHSHCPYGRTRARANRTGRIRSGGRKMNMSRPPLAQRVYAQRRPRHWDFAIPQPPHHPTKQKEHSMSRKPLIILIGAEKGGVGKTTCARAMSDYLQSRGANARIFDGEFPVGDLKRFAPAATIVDLATTAGQMLVFDTLHGATVG